MALVVFWDSLSVLGDLSVSLSLNLIRGLRASESHRPFFCQIFGTVFYVGYVAGRICPITGTLRNGSTFKRIILLSIKSYTVHRQQAVLL
jgi:hypothetical protein